MKVEVLYVSECPYYPAAVKLVKDVLAAKGVGDELQNMQQSAFGISLDNASAIDNN